jgi:hypothetical protein
MFSCANIDKHGRFKDGNSHPSLQEQEYGRKRKMAQNIGVEKEEFL